MRVFVKISIKTLTCRPIFSCTLLFNKTNFQRKIYCFKIALYLRVLCHKIKNSEKVKAVNAAKLTVNFQNFFY